MIFKVSDLMVKEVGFHSAIVYHYITGWIRTNADKKRKTAFRDGRVWTYSDKKTLVNTFANMMGARNFERAVKKLLDMDYLCREIVYNGNDKQIWFSLGNKLPNIPQEDMPLGKNLAEFLVKDDTQGERQDCRSLTQGERQILQSERQICRPQSPLDRSTSEPTAPQDNNKDIILKDNNNKDIGKIPQKEEDKNTLTPMSGIIDTLLGELKSSSVVVVDNNLSDVLGIDFNDPSTHDKIVALGVSLNVEQETMANLIKKYGLPAVAKQLVNLNYQQKVSPASNPAGWIVTAVARNYALNQQALECVKTQKQKQKEREEYNAMVAQMQLEDEERKQREHEEFLKNGPDFDTIDEEFLGFWLCHDKNGFIEKKYRAFLTGKGIPEDQHDAIIAEKRNIRNEKSCL